MIAISQVIGKHGGIYASHIRGEGTGLVDSLQEILKIGREAKLPVHVSHFKASGKQAWGSLHLGIELLEQARREGVAVTADQYPYVASSTSLEATLLPDWVREGGRPAIAKRLADADTRARIRSELEKKLGTASRIVIASYRQRRDWVGKSIEEIAQLEKRDAQTSFWKSSRRAGASVVNFSMQEEDVQFAMRAPWVATASDGGAKLPSADRPHPRSFGTFPRKIGYYGRQLKLLSVQQAIRSSTGLPADILVLMTAVIYAKVLSQISLWFDPETFIDTATFEDPFQAPTGLKHVFVAGVPAVYNGQATGALAGVALRKKQVARETKDPPQASRSTKD